MSAGRSFPSRWRTVALAAALSVAVHAAFIGGYGGPRDDEPKLDLPEYTATLEEAPPAPAAVAPPAPAPRVRHRARPRPAVSLPGEVVASMPEPVAAEDLAPPLENDVTVPEMLAYAEQAVPLELPELPSFRPEALPDTLTIRYALTSVFADGQASYTWHREGDRYEISGTAEAVGFFTLFLQGSIDQASTGVVTKRGLKPDRFTEKRGDTPEEGLTFDWSARKVEFYRGDNRRTGPLADATVDWLSMIFQLATVPPTTGPMTLRVFTQRKMYEFHLQVLGVEELDLPFGRARTLHLHHDGDSPDEAVDVWLGLDQYNLPVKLRYPVARNRLMVEQTATSVEAR